ncbi:MAG: 2-keto-4-pentenoate hydratase [Hyphomicrobiales bacterium]
MTADTATLAQALIEARRLGRLATFAPEMVPASVAEAMRAQEMVAEATGASVAGWKVGYTPEEVPVAGPLFGNAVYRNGAAPRLGPSGKSGIEVEIALRLGRDLPPRPGRPYSRAEILDASQAMLAGVEIVETRFPSPPKPPFLTLLADNISNGGYICGPDIRDFRKLDLERLRCRLSVDGRVVHEGVGGHAKGDPLIPVIDYASRPCDLLGGLKAGQVVTTGTLSGCPYFEGACRIAAEIDGLGSVAFEIKG